MGNGTPPDPARMRVSAGITIRFGNDSAPSCSGTKSGLLDMAIFPVECGMKPKACAQADSVQCSLSCRLAKAQLTEVEGNEKGLRHLLHVLVIGVDAPLGRHLDALEFDVVADIVGAACAAQDIDGVVVATHQPVG